MPTDDDNSPQKRIDQLLQNTITPLLKPKGYRKSAHTWHETEHPITKILNVQLSQGNSANEAKFTLNLGIYHETFHLVDHGPFRGKFPKEYECDVRSRIGELMKVSDHWWTVNWMTNMSDLENDIRDKVENLAIPWLDSFHGLPELLQHFITTSRHFDAAIASHLLALPTVPQHLIAACQTPNEHYKRNVQRWAANNGYKI